MRSANVQGWPSGIPWSLHEKAWSVYAQKYSGQSAERIHERGGFHVSELDQFIPGWREEVSEIARLRAERDEAVGLLTDARNLLRPAKHTGVLNTKWHPMLDRITAFLAKQEKADG